MKSTTASSKQATLERQEERENWHKLVVKIINWKDGNLSKTNDKDIKITKKEWTTYSKKVLETNISSKQKTLANLQQTKDLIQKHGGFEA